MITGAEKPDTGSIVLGETVKLAAVNQTREGLPNDKTVFEAISGGLDILQVGKFEMSSRAYLGRFNFKGGDQQKTVGADVCIWRQRSLRAATCCFLTNRPTTLTSKRCALSKKRFLSLRAALLLRLTTVGSLTASPHISLRLKATVRSCSLTATTTSTKPTSERDSAKKPRVRTACASSL